MKRLPTRFMTNCPDCNALRESHLDSWGLRSARAQFDKCDGCILRERGIKKYGPESPLAKPQVVEQAFGISRRDYFAAMALQGMLAAGEHKNDGWKRTVDAAFSYADKMVIASEEQE